MLMLLAYDDSPSARAAEGYVTQNLDPEYHEILLVQVVEELPTVYLGESEDPTSFQSWRVKRARDTLDEIATRLREAGFDVSTEVLDGEPGLQILTSAKDHDVDGIILGRRGRGSVKEMLLGSVSQYVLHHASRPVTLVSP